MSDSGILKKGIAGSSLKKLEILMWHGIREFCQKMESEKLLKLKVIGYTKLLVVLVVETERFQLHQIAGHAVVQER